MSKSIEEEGLEVYGKNEDSGDDVKEMLMDGFMDYFMFSLENV